jgi:hypothetical protein
VSRWTITGRDARVVVRVPLLELSRIPEADLGTPALETWLGASVAERVVLRAEGVPCAVVDVPTVLRPAPDRVTVAWRMRCAATGALAIESRLLHAVAPAHVHFAQVTRDDGGSVERILSAQAPRWVLPAANGEETAAPAGFGGYVRLGLAHIAGGLDHLVFLLALVLVARGGREVATVVTGFTIGHSLTLAAAALGVLRPEGRAVEALIGLSIALVACERAATPGGAPAVAVVWAVALAALAVAGGLGGGGVPVLTLLGMALFAACHFLLLGRSARPAQVRAAVALLFGLVHGLGFGGFLLEVGLPPARVVRALFGFNLGVELGQLVIVGLAWPIVARVVRGRALVADGALGGVVALGLYWFVARGWG